MLGARHVLAIIVGIVIGAGIFRTPALVAGAAGSEAAFLLVWLLGGLLSITGALCYAELAAAFPSAGGDYHFLSRAFGRRVGFLYAWARLAVIQTGSLALLAFLFGDYAAAIFPLGPQGPALYAAAAVIALTLLNWVHVRGGTGSQLWLTLIEVAGLVGIVAVALALPAAPAGAAPTAGSGFGLMLVFVLLTYGGWSEAAYVSAELRGGGRRMAWVLVSSLALITLLYLLVNWAYLRALGLGGLAASDAVAAELVDRALGPAGAVAISLLVAVSALTSANATSITGARTTYALGCAFPQLSWLGRWHDRAGTPRNALLAQGALALLLVLGGAFARDGFRMAVEYTAPVFWFFLLLVGLSLFVLRAREPDAPRPFRVPLYPVLPAIFCLTSLYLLYSSVAYTGASALVGVAVLAVGALLLLFLRNPRAEETR
jgi:APA family basic amino acid/polyamine antiporter